jgi:pyridoxal phosphate enzyme (YggS family)
MSFADLPDRVADIRARIGSAVARGGHNQSVTIVAVTKTHGPEAADAAFEAGIADVGENRVQEALRKMPLVRSPVRWHLIGHLQRNKVRSLEQFHLLHSLDSSRLADAVRAFAGARGRAARVLLEVNVSGEASKGGFSPSDAEREGDRLRGVSEIELAGVMTMAPLDAPESVLRAAFGGARAVRDQLRRIGHPATELSMGMSSDYEIAVEEGATLVRLGTILFGMRQT